NRLRDLAEAVILIRVELRGTIIQHAADMGRLVGAPDYNLPAHFWPQLARIVEPHAAFERFFRALQCARCDVGICGMEPVMESRLRVVAAAKGVGLLVPIECIAKAEKTVQGEYPAGHALRRIGRWNVGGLIEFNAIPLPVGIDCLQNTGCATLDLGETRYA